MRLKNWAIVLTGSEYTAPECRQPALIGDVYDSERFIPGMGIRTSPVKSVDLDNMTVTTTSGSVYRLDNPSEDWQKFLFEQNSNAMDMLYRLAKVDNGPMANVINFPSHKRNTHD